MKYHVKLLFQFFCYCSNYILKKMGIYHFLQNWKISVLQMSLIYNNLNYQSKKFPFILACYNCGNSVLKKWH